MSKSGRSEDSGVVGDAGVEGVEVVDVVGQPSLLFSPYSVGQSSSQSSNPSLSESLGHPRESTIEHPGL